MFSCCVFFAALAALVLLLHSHHATPTTSLPYHFTSVPPIPPPHTTHRHTTPLSAYADTWLVLGWFLVGSWLLRLCVAMACVTVQCHIRIAEGGGYGACLIYFFFWGAENIVVGFLRKLFLPDIMYTPIVYTGGKYYLMGEKPYAEPIYIRIFCC